MPLVILVPGFLTIAKCRKRTRQMQKADPQNLAVTGCSVPIADIRTNRKPGAITAWLSLCRRELLQLLLAGPPPSVADSARPGS